MSPRYDRLLLMRRSDRSCHTGIEVQKLKRESEDMNKSLSTVTQMNQRGFDQPVREQGIYAREQRRLTDQVITGWPRRGQGLTPLWLQILFASRHRTVWRQPLRAGGWISEQVEKNVKQGAPSFGTGQLGVRKLHVRQDGVQS